MINKGQHISPKTEFKKGHKIWLGKKHSEESKRKMRKPKSEDYKKKLSKILKGHKKSNTINYHKPKSVPSSFKGKERPELQGKKHWNWQGGISDVPYDEAFNIVLRDKVRVRDKHICQECGVPELECNRKHSVHHIDEDKSNSSMHNLILLCQSCHNKIHVRRDKKTGRFICLEKF